MRVIRAAFGPGEVRIAVVEDGQLMDLAIWRPGAPDGLGDIHVGRIIARVPAMAGAFMALAGAEGFLPDSDGAAQHGEGDMITVRITRTAQGGKGPRLSATPEPAPAGPPRLLRRGASPLARLAAAYPGADILVDDPALLSAEPGRTRLVAHAFDDELEAEIESLAATQADLPGGLRATITPTPALTAIDLDMAGATASRAEKTAAQLAGNRAALPALARQIRLRNLGGAILIDFAGIPIKRRAALAPALEAALATDPVRPRLLGFSHLGLAEILRPRGTAPLHELLHGPLAAGLAALRRIARELPNRPGWRPVLRAAPAVVAALQADPVALPDLARRATYPLILTSDPALPIDRWAIEDAT